MTSRNSAILLLDGATGSELHRRGVDLPLPLWSARAILDAPDMLETIHREYLEAGADLITANTFRTHRRSLDKAGMGDRARELTRRAVEIAQRARDQVNRGAKVLGSVAPLEDCYRPDLAPAAAECEREHREMIDHLLDAGVDGVLIETQTNRREALAAALQARDAIGARNSSVPWIMSFCTRSHGPPSILLSGESIVDLLPALGGAFALGVNCVAAPVTEAQIKVLRALVPSSTRLIAYANIGAPDANGVWSNNDADIPDAYAAYAQRWISAGATIIGGCCGTRPATIRAIAQSLPPRTR